jgi:hypothetical protein
MSALRCLCEMRAYQKNLPREVEDLVMKQDPVNKKSRPDKPGRIYAKRLFARNPLPIARGSNGDYQLGSSPGSESSLDQTFPGLHTPVVHLGLAPHYSGGTAPVLHRTSLLSPHGHLTFSYEVVALHCHNTIIAVSCQTHIGQN